MNGRWLLQQRLEDPPGLLDAILTGEARAVPTHRVEQQHLVGGGGLPALLGELHVERDRLGAAEVGAVRVEDHARAGRGIELDDELVRLGAAMCMPHEAEAGRVAEDGPQLGLRGGKLLARADEPRHARPAPVVDVQPHGRIGLRRRVLGDALDVEVSVVLPAYVVSRIGVLDRSEQRELRVLERVGVVARRRLHRREGDHLHEVVHDDVAQCTDGVIEAPAVLHAEALRHRDLTHAMWLRFQIGSIIVLAKRR